MKCLACGRELVSEGTYFVCPNFLCDYSEEIENEEVMAPARYLESVHTTIAWAIK